MGAGPLRTCVSCRQTRPQRELIKVVRAPDGRPRVVSHGRGRPPGRGAYVCPQAPCIEAALGSKLARALRLGGPLPPELADELRRAAAAPGGEGR
jgi:predicted RNA-binding protein YlxR (DUF448 family)